MPLADLTDSPPDDGGPKKIYIYGDRPEAAKEVTVADDGQAQGAIPADSNSTISSAIDRIVGRLTGTGGYERYQTWPEKMVREAVSAPHDAMTGELPMTSVDPLTGEVHTSSQAIEAAQAIAGMAGTGGLSSMTDATLGSTPFLRPALKYGEKIYKAPANGQHLDAIPPDIYPEFQRQAMSGEDISNFNFGFMNHKGQFLDRQKALDYALEHGLVDQDASKYGALTSTLMSDSSQPGVALEAMAKAGKITNLKGEKIDAPRVFYRGTNPGDTRRISTGIADWDSHLFAADNVDAAKMYGSDIAQYQAKPDAKILYEGTKEFNNVAGKIKKDENLLQYSHRAAAAAKAAGYDAAWFKRQGDVGTAIFNPDKFILKSDNDAGAALQAVKASQPFFSAVEHAVNNTSQPKMTGAQWLGTLSNKPGVKPEEMQWTGLQDFLKENGDKPVTQAQVQEHLANNKVELKEVNKGTGDLHKAAKDFNAEAGPKAIDIKGRGQLYADEIEQGLWDGSLTPKDLPTNLQPHAEKMLSLRHQQESPTKYHSYQLPGGENYREMLMTLPNKQKAAAEARANQIMDRREKIQDRFDELHGKDDLKVLKERKLLTGEFNDLTDELRNLNLQDYANGKGGYKSSHWDEPNILAHVRMNDRAIDGKKSLHLEEIQSDWHQQGRDKGYKSDTPKFSAEKNTELENLRTELKGLRSQDIKDFKEGTKAFSAEELIKSDKWKRFNELSNEKRNAENPPGVPDAPFKKTWHELALKRMIREAAEKGYDRLSWTPGEAQAARYDLSKSVDEVRLVPKNKNTDPNFEYRIDAFKNGERVTTKPANNEKDVADIVGKEVAKKLFEENKDNKGSSLKGQQLSIGGEGMKGFYDQIIPKAIEKIGKEHGVKVQKGDLNAPKIRKFKTNSGQDRFELRDKDGVVDVFNSEAELQKHLKSEPVQSQPIHFIDIPQSLRDTAMHKGFPLFSGGLMFTPVAGDPTK